MTLPPRRHQPKKQPHFREQLIAETEHGGCSDDARCAPAVPGPDSGNEQPANSGGDCMTPALPLGRIAWGDS